MTTLCYNLSDFYDIVLDEVIDYVEKGLEYHIELDIKDNRIILFDLSVYCNDILEDEREDIEFALEEIIDTNIADINDNIEDLDKKFLIDKIKFYNSEILEIKLKGDFDRTDLKSYKFLRCMQLTEGTSDKIKLEKELEEERKKTKRLQSCSCKKIQLYNGISPIYGRSIGIYDQDGNKICDGYNPDFDDKRIYYQK